MEKKGKEVKDATTAIGIAREHFERQMSRAYWRDAKEVRFDEENNEWVVICEVSPSYSAPYYDYEVKIDSNTGYVKSSKRLEKEE